VGRLDGRVAIVTGGARGIGAAVARLLVTEGAHVVVADILEAEGRGLVAQLGGRSRFQPLDVSSEGGWQRTAAETERELGPVPVLVNNAGIMEWGTMEEQTLARSAASSTSTSRMPGWACAPSRPRCAARAAG
jgi:3alpha(or 20beta)-hydroxysteroid dehydrogenase